MDSYSDTGRGDRHNGKSRLIFKSNFHSAADFSIISQKSRETNLCIFLNIPLLFKGINDVMCLIWVGKSLLFLPFCILDTLFSLSFILDISLFSAFLLFSRRRRRRQNLFFFVRYLGQKIATGIFWPGKEKYPISSHPSSFPKYSRTINRRSVFLYFPTVFFSWVKTEEVGGMRNVQKKEV